MQLSRICAIKASVLSGNMTNWMQCVTVLSCQLSFIWLGVFITKGDVGVGTIVGSAVFNILCIIGVCGIFAGQVNLPMRPFSRCM